MAKSNIKVELVLETGSLVDALTELSDGLKSSGVESSPKLSAFLTDWVRRNTVPSLHGKVAELSRRLSRYECVYHEPPIDGCEDCEKHR